VARTGIPVYGLKSHKGFWRFLTLRHSNTFDNWMVNVVTSDEVWGSLDPIAEDLGREFPSISTFVHTINSRKAAIAVGERERVLSGEGYLVDKIGQWTFRVSASSFFQTNTGAAKILYDTVANFAGLTGSEYVLDLYSGTGTIPIYLSDGAAGITGMEINDKAVLDARINCETNRVHNCRFVCGDIKSLLEGIKSKPSVVIIDPPRSGMHKDVAVAIAALQPGRMVYVSCNPATMGRDLALLSSSYEICEIQPVDMFPHTHHVECVVRMKSRLQG
jgi:23S rRNA (uracil1939-C5)-methyltransferase